MKRITSVRINISVGGTGAPLLANQDFPIELPEGFQVDDNGPERRISFRWFSWHAMKGIIFAAIFSVPIAVVIYAYMHGADKSWPTPALAGSLLFALPPAAILYGWLAYLVNRTTVTVNDARVSVRHGPLPWWGARDIARSDISDVISERFINDNDSSDGSIFQPREVYSVKLRLKSGRSVRLVNGLLDPDQALYLEQQIRNG